MKNHPVISQVSTRNISCKRILPHLDDDDLDLDNEVKQNIRKLCKYKRAHPNEVGYKGLLELSHSKNKEADELVNEITNYVNLKFNNSVPTLKSSKRPITEEELLMSLGKLKNETPSMIKRRLNNYRSRGSI
jgi:hypothetical protein